VLALLLLRASSPRGPDHLPQEPRQVEEKRR